MDGRGREGFGLRDAHVRRRGTFGPDEDTAYEEMRDYGKYFSPRNATSLESQYVQCDGYDNGSYEPRYERCDQGGSSVIRRSDHYRDNGYGDRSHGESYGNGIGCKDYCEDDWKSSRRKHRQSFKGDDYEDQRQYREDGRYGARRNGSSKKLREDDYKGHGSGFYDQRFGNQEFIRERAVADVDDWGPEVEVHSASGEHGVYNYRQHDDHRSSRNRGQGNRSLSCDMYRTDLCDEKDLGGVDDKRVHPDYNYHPSKRHKVRDIEGRPGQAEESCSRYSDYSCDSGRMQSYGDYYSREESFGKSRRPPPGTQLELCEQRMSRPRTPSFEDGRPSDDYQNGRRGLDNEGYEVDDMDRYEHWSYTRQERRDRGDSLCYRERSAGDGGSLLDHNSEQHFYNSRHSGGTTEGHPPENLSSVQKEEGNPVQERALRSSAEIADKPPAMGNSVAVPKRMPLTSTTFAPNGESTGNLLDIPQRAEDPPVVLRRRGESLMPHGSQRFATMKNAKKIAKEMGMEEAKAEARAEVEQAVEVLEDYAGRVQRTSWAKRNQIQKAPTQEGDKFDAWELKSFKAMKKASELSRDVTTWFTMWSSALKTIEGHFGTGVVSYFLFLRWLLLVNLLMFLLPALFIITPHWILPTVFALASSNDTSASSSNSSGLRTFPEPSTLAFSSVSLSPTSQSMPPEDLHGDDVWSGAENRTPTRMQECYRQYQSLVTSQSKEGISRVQDFLQGTGWMELTALFSGRYINSVDHIPGTRLGYNFPLAFVLTNVFCFVLCLLLMVRYTTAGVREALLVSEGKLHRYCNLVFASWDFCITDERTARLKHVSIVQELKSDLAEERRTAEIASWSRRKKVGLFVVRLFVNLVVLAVIVGSLFAVYNATSFSFKKQSQAPSTSKTLALLIQFVPSLVITGLNLVVPGVFSKLIRLENYSIAFQVKLTLLRTVFLRFTSIFVLLLSLYKQINCAPVREENCLEGDGDCKKPMCWETAVGQQIYKLTILDFIVGVTLVFVVECPRKLIVTRCQCKLAKVIGQQEFNIPNRVLDLVYSQTLCWLGTFYCPLLPAITMVKYFIIFYVQKFTLMSNSAPSQTPYRASRSNTFFVIVLLLALFLAVIPFAYALVEIQPSLSCGPFQKYQSTWQVVPETIHSWGTHAWGWYVVKAVDFFTSVAFGVPVVVVLMVCIYYYYSVAAAHTHMEKVLKDKLVLEGKDKQFLLARITEVARQRPSSTA
ncbi:uncharacterized protein LOC144138117 isoform X1 [Haemaphysalis longicornis]